MRVLVVGAGAVGSYFGGRLLEIGRDVTFLVRPKRQAQLAATGLVIQSPLGNLTVPAPPTVLASDLGTRGPFDLVLLSCKAYDLEDAIASFAPGIGPSTAILPLLNGMRHLDVLDQLFGRDHVLGGQCQIGATLDESGRMIHLNTVHLLSFGDRAGRSTPRVEAIAETMTGANFDARASEAILREMWEKWLFLASLAGATCLLRGTVGDIVEAGAGWIPLQLLEECRAIAERAGIQPEPAFLDRIRSVLTAPGSPFTASMLRDIERGARTEADHVFGDLAARAGEVPPMIRLVCAHLETYEARRARTAAEA